MDAFGRIQAATSQGGYRSITSAQGKIAFLYAGILDQAITSISRATDTTERRVKQIQFDAPFWNRNDLFTFLCQQLNLTSQRMNEIFLDAPPLKNIAAATRPLFYSSQVDTRASP